MRGLIWVSPLVLLTLTWVGSLVVAVRVLGNPERFDLAHYFIWQHHLDLASFNLWAGFGIALLFAVFVTAYAAFGFALPAPRPVFRAGMVPDFDPVLAVRLLWWVNLTFLGVTALWIVLTARQHGGLLALVRLVQQDANLARDLLLENKLFTGMRLFYAALPATGCLAAAILTLRAHVVLPRGTVLACVAIIILNLVALMILPVVMSQRLILLQYLISAYVTVCMVRGRLVAVWLIPVALALFFLTWVAHEAVTNPDIDRPATEIAVQKLAFYIINDLWNSFRPFDTEVPHTYGLFSLQFAVFFSLSDVYFFTFFADRIQALEEARGGGEFSLFSAPLVDFGMVGAAVYLVVLAGLVRFAFHYGRERIVWAVIYGQVATAIILSVHVNYFASQDFVFSLIVMALVMHQARLPIAVPDRAPDTPRRA